MSRCFGLFKNSRFADESSLNTLFFHQKEKRLLNLPCQRIVLWGKLEIFQNIFQVLPQQWINRLKLVKIIDLYYYKGTKLKAMFLHLS